MIVLWILLYIAIASICTFFLDVTAEKYARFQPDFDFPWPVLCGIFWPVAVPIAAAYIAAQWYLDSEE